MTWSIEAEGTARARHSLFISPRRGSAHNGTATGDSRAESRRVTAHGRSDVGRGEEGRQGIPLAGGCHKLGQEADRSCMSPPSRARRAR